MTDTNNTAASGTATGELPDQQPQQHLNIDDSTIEKIGALTVAAANVRSIGDAHYLILPPEYKHVDVTKAVEAALPEPHRKSGHVTLADLPSFLAYVTEQTLDKVCYIYADPDSRTLTAVLNDHARGFGVPGWRDFRVSYTAALSREFSAWHKNDRKEMSQEEFAVFLEDNVADIAEPSGETMLAVALTLQAKTEVSFASHRRLDNGQVQLSYTENIDARAGGNGEITIPREFALGLRLFKNGEGYKVRARLKYRLHSGKVKFWYELDRVENAIEDAFKAYVEQSRTSGYQVLIGRP